MRIYAKARRGELKNFTGIDSDYEPPELAEVHLRAMDMKPDSCVEMIARLSFANIRVIDF